MEVNLKDKNYELYKRHKVDIFNILYDVFERSPEPPVPFFFSNLMTEEEKIQYEKELNSYLEIEKPKVASKLKEMGFEIKS
mgnify:CR=1 FL=1